MENALTIDVEDYFHVSAFAGRLPRTAWTGMENRVTGNTGRILDLLAEKNIHATFFVLGWVGRRFPGLVRRIADQGHEVASHGLDHLPTHLRSPGDFSREAVESKRLLEEISGREVLGYRAASFSFGTKTPWAWRVLAQAGYRYSSSVYPIRHDLYGMPDAPRFPFTKDGLWEIPITTLPWAGLNLPLGGGGYFRLLPYAYYHWGIKRLHRREGRPSVFYFHPWELDPDQPRLDGLSLKSRFRHYVNLSGCQERLTRLLGDFSWNRMDRVFLPGDGS